MEMDMSKHRVLEKLRGSDDFVSGESISEILGISRAAVWKNVKLLRQEGYVISSKTNRGYKLEAEPDILETEKIAAAANCVIAGIHCCASVDSTNNELKKMALEGAAEGTVLIADHQTAGRGRFGRSFVSPKSRGIYMSILLKPESVADIAGLTCMTAVAICKAIKKVIDVEPDIKWPNDVLLGGKKVCGILTELSAEGESGEIRYVVVGIGVNVNHRTEDFPKELRDIAGSLYMTGGETVDRNVLAGQLISSVLNMYMNINTERSEYMDEYRRRCVTLGKTVEFYMENRSFMGEVKEIEEDGALVVRLEDGQRHVIRFGEVSIVN